MNVIIKIVWLQNKHFLIIPWITCIKFSNSNVITIYIWKGLSLPWLTTDDGIIYESWALNLGLIFMHFVISAEKPIPPKFYGLNSFGSWTVQQHIKKINCQAIPWAFDRNFVYVSLVLSVKLKCKKYIRLY